MFNTKVERHSHHYGGGNTNVTVTEHRAPTDESIRLAEEMRDKITNSILYCQRIDNNIFNYRFSVLAEGNFYTKIRIDAIINGKDYSAERELNGLFPNELEMTFNDEGEKVYEKKYGYQQIIILRKQMLVELLFQAMYDTNPDEFTKYDKIIGNTIHDYWSKEDFFR